MLEAIDTSDVPAFCFVYSPRETAILLRKSIKTIERSEVTLVSKSLFQF